MRWLEIPPTAGLAPRFGDLFSRPRPGALAQALARMLGEPAQVECSGTACLVVALEALKETSPRRSVIIPAYTCPLVVLAAHRAGLRTIACDLAPDSFEMDEARLIELAGQDALCVIATHYSGALTDVARLRRILAPEIAIVEDAAQAFGAAHGARWAGLSGDVGFFSFALGKGFTTFEGGALVARTPEMRARLARVGSRMRRRRPGLSLWLDFEFAAYHFLYNGLGLKLIYGLSKNFWLRRGDETRALGDYFADDIPIYPISAWREAAGAAALARLKPHLAWSAAVRARIGAGLAHLSPPLRMGSGVGRPTGTLVFVTFPTAESCAQALAALWREPLGVSKLFAFCIGDYAYLAGKLSPSATPNARSLAARTLTISASVQMRDADLAEIVSRLASAVADQ